jgi:hypothetical protein
MMNFSAYMLSASMKSRRSSALLASIAATVLFTGFAPQIAQPVLEYVFGSPALAQTQADVAKYARAAYDIEKLRQSRYAEAKRLMGGNVPGDVCRQQDIPANVRGICNDFLRESGDIIKRNGLTVSQFNAITLKKDSDANLQRQIQQELLQLQKAGR